MEKISYIICFLIIYLYVFAPPFQVLPFGMDKPIMLWAYIYITYKNEWGEVYNIFRKEFQLLVLILCYSIFIFLLTRVDKTMVIFDTGLLMGVIPCAYAIYRYVVDFHGFKVDKLIMNCAIVAAVISFYLIINPSIAYFLKTEILKYPEGLADRLMFRGYGFSDGLLFSYPVIEGICVGFLLLGFYNSSVYYIFLIPMLIAIFTNARSGLIPIMASLIILFSLHIRRFIKLMTTMLIVCMLFLTSLTIFIEQNEMLKQAYEWGMSSFDILGDFFNGEKTENIEILLSDEMQVYPENLTQWIIGSGEYIYAGARRSTDIGYLLRLNYGGFFYLVLWCLLTIYMFKRLKKVNKSLALLLIVPVSYYMLKSDFFVPTPSIRFYFLIYVIAIINHSAFTKRKVECFYGTNKIIRDI